MAKGKTALVLSAGGMFGAFQAGVWAELCRVFDPDIVVGASVGSLNGWLIASGCTGEELIERWRYLPGSQSIRWRLPRTLMEGCVDSSDLEATVQQMCRDWTPRREYGVVLTELRSMHPRLFRWPEAGWEHLIASCSVPVFLHQRTLGGARFSDGGLVDPLPLQAAVDMGATAIVTVNLLNHRPWFIRQVVRGLRAYSRYTPAASTRLRVVDISPRGAMGSARDSMYWRAGRSGRWIEEGRKEARAATQSVVELVVQHNRGDEGASECPNIAYTG